MVPLRGIEAHQTVFVGADPQRACAVGRDAADHARRRRRRRCDRGSSAYRSIVSVSRSSLFDAAAVGADPQIARRGRCAAPLRGRWTAMRDRPGRCGMLRCCAGRVEAEQAVAVGADPQRARAVSDDGAHDHGPRRGSATSARCSNMPVSGSRRSSPPPSVPTQMRAARHLRAAPRPSCARALRRVVLVVHEGDEVGSRRNGSSLRRCRAR